MRPPAWSMERCCRLLADRSNEKGGLGSLGFYSRATPGVRAASPPPGGGSVLYKSERALAVVVQSEVGTVE